jgi:hypothetical protein
LFTALQTLEKRDIGSLIFFEKNMFISSSGNFLLIDLDNARPLKDLPDKERWGCKDYCAQVFKILTGRIYIILILNPPAFMVRLSITSMLFFLILRLKLFYLNEGLNMMMLVFLTCFPIV